MNRFLIHFYLVTTLLCYVLGSKAEVRAQMFIFDKPTDEQQIKKNDGFLKPMAEEPQSPIEVAFRTAPSSHRIASSRSTRLLPTHGGKNDKHHGRWAKDNVYKPLKKTTPQPCRSHDRLYTVAAPPRLYYVIALRRLLC